MFCVSSSKCHRFGLQPVIVAFPGHTHLLGYFLLSTFTCTSSLAESLYFGLSLQLLPTVYASSDGAYKTVPLSMLV